MEVSLLYTLGIHCAHMRVHVCMYRCGGQRTSCMSWFSSLCVPKIQNSPPESSPRLSHPLPQYYAGVPPSGILTPPFCSFVCLVLGGLFLKQGLSM